MAERPLVFIDSETGGLDDSRNPLLEVAWVRGDDPFISLVRLAHRFEDCDKRALAVNGYYERGLHDPRSWDQTPLHRVSAALRGAVLVAANPSFDERFLLAAFRKAGLDGWATWHHRKIDIESYAMPIMGYPRPVSLAKLAEDLGEGAQDHTATGDVDLLRRCYRKLEAVAESYKGVIRRG